MKDKIKKDRKERDMTLKQYAELLQVDQNTVWKWENGKRNPTRQVQLLITFSTEALKIAAKNANK